MRTQVGFVGLSNVENEMRLLSQRAQDSSRAGVPLRSVYESVAVSNDLYNIRTGLSCDVALSIPQPLCNAISRFACAQTLDSYSSRIHVALVDPDGRYSVLKKMEDFCQILKSETPAGDPLQYSAKILDDLRASVKTLADKCNESYKFLSDLQSEVFKDIKVEIQSINSALSGLSGQYEDMKKSDHSQRALMTGRYYDSLLDLSENIAINVPLSGIEEGDMPAKVSLNMPGRVLADTLKGKLILGVDLVDPDEYLDAVQILLEKYEPSDASGAKIEGILYADFSTPPNNTNGSPATAVIGGKTLLKVDSSKDQGHGKLGALLQLYTKVIPDQQRNLHKVGAEVEKLVPAGLAVLAFDQNKIDVSKGAAAKIFDPSGAPFKFSGFPGSSVAIISALDICQNSLSAISEMRNSSIKEKEISETLLQRSQSERDEFVKISQEQYLARMWELNLQKELLMRILDVMMNFYKSVAKLGLA
jgi:hypothetical protein